MIFLAHFMHVSIARRMFRIVFEAVKAG